MLQLTTAYEKKARILLGDRCSSFNLFFFIYTFYRTVKWGKFGPLFGLEGRLQKNHTQYGGETFFKLGAHDVGENIR